MKKLYYIIFFLCLLFQSCTQKYFVHKNRQVDLLPMSIPIDSVRILNPFFSGNKVLGNKIEWSYPISTEIETKFKNNIISILDSFNLKSNNIFHKTNKCISSKMHAENWTNYTWNLANTYECLKIDQTYYTVLFYNILELWEPTGTTIKTNDNSYIHTFIKVFYKGRILYTRSYRYTKKLSNKEQKAFEKENINPFFKEEQVKHVIEKVTQDLFRRIQPK